MLRAGIVTNPAHPATLIVESSSPKSRPWMKHG